MQYIWSIIIGIFGIFEILLLLNTTNNKSKCVNQRDLWMNGNFDISNQICGTKYDKTFTIKLFNLLICYHFKNKNVN